MGKKSDLGIKVLKFSQGNYLKHLEACIRQGIAVLVENVQEELDPAIEPVLQKQITVKGATKTLKLGDAVIEYNDNFQFYMATKLRNPHYLPEVSTKVTLLNFMITYEGLTDQLLGIVVAKENPDLEDKKANLVRESAESKRQLATTEAQILKVLNEVSDILGDDGAIQILDNASILSKDIAKKQEKAKVTEKEIDDKRTEYEPVALRTAGLFFCVQELANIDPMYQYSLPFFVNLFEIAIAQAEKSDVIDERLKFLDNQFLESLFKNVCISLFEKDKMIFSFLLCLKLLELSKELDPSELKFFLTGGVALGDDYGEKPAPWVDDKIWGELNRACATPGMRSFLPHFKAKVAIYQQLFESKEPHNWEFPEDAVMVSPFRKLMILRAVRPDKVVPGVSNFVVT
jgi:dynein heavy chain